MLKNKTLNAIHSYFDKGFLPLFYALFFMAGIAFWRLFPEVVDQQSWFIISVLLAVFTGLLYLLGRNLWLLVIFMQSFFMGGVVYYERYAKNALELTSSKYLNATYWLEGNVRDISLRKSRSYLIVDVAKVYNYSGRAIQAVRLSIPNKHIEEVVIGDSITGQFYLQSIEGATFEGDFDFQRYALDNRFSATGYLRGDFYLTKSENTPIHSRIYSLRSKLTEKLANSYEYGGLMTALTTAIRGFVSVDVKESFQKSGLAHLLAISGMHLGFIAGFVFFLIRGAVSFSEKLSYSISGKKVAAVSALVVCWFYAAMAGFTIPTLRAAILLTALFVAVLLERQRLQIRILSFAALFVLVLWPESLFGASFQMSFATALVLIYWANTSDKQGLGYFKLIWATTLLASLITIPLVAYHFSQVSIAGFVANLVAIPLTAFLLLPSLFLGVVFNSDLLLGLANYSSGLLIDLAKLMAGFELSSIYVPQEYLWLVSSIAIFSLVLRLGNKYKYMFYLSFVFVFVSLFYVKNAQDFAVDRLYYMAEGDTYFVVKDKEIYKLKTDLSDARYNRIIGFFSDKRGLKPSDTSLCSLSQGCVLNIEGKSVLVPSEGFYPQLEDCAEVDAIFTADVDSFKNLLCYDKLKKIASESRSAYLVNVNNRLQVENYPK